MIHDRHHPASIAARKALRRECAADLAVHVAGSGAAMPVRFDARTDDELREAGYAAVSRSRDGTAASLRAVFTDPDDMAAWIRAELRRGRTVILFPRKEPT